MSFFVSESLKDVITEEDLAAESPIKIIEEKEIIQIQFRSDDTESFKAKLVKINFCDEATKITAAIDNEDLKYIFNIHNKKVNYFIPIHGCSYMQDCGVFIINELETNNEDNYVTCKIDIFKRSY